MEFKFRAGDQRPPLPVPPPPRAFQYVPPRPPAVYCLSKPGFPDGCLRRTTNIITLRKPFESNEEMHWEMELMRLREEKLLAEIERQRFLKEEARRELMLFEREMAIRGAAQSAGYPLRQPQQQRIARFSAAAAPAPPSCPFPSPQQWIAPSPPSCPFPSLRRRRIAPFSAAAAPSPSSCPLPSPSTAVVVQSFHERQKMERVKSSARLEFGAVASPIQPLMAEDKKEPKVEADEREQLIVLEKPDPNAFREKRKAETTQPPNDVIQPSVVNKKTCMEVWSCAMCKVTAPNERIFNAHLQGKKHMRNEASLRPIKESKLSRAALEQLPRKKRKRCKAIAAAGAEGTESKDGEKTLRGEKTEGSVDMKALIPNFVKLGDENDNNKQQKQWIVVGQNPITNDEILAKNKFVFWCEKCKVGAYDTEVILAHVNGKEHQTNL